MGSRAFWLAFVVVVVACTGEDPSLPPAVVGADGGTTPGTRACEPQTRACDGKVLQKCKLDGSGFVVDQTCKDSCDVARAQCSSCEVGTTRCNGKRLETCAPDGRTFDLVRECPTAEACDEANATCLACGVAGAKLCVGQDVHSCNPDRKATTPVKSCGSLGCDPATNDCRTCNPGGSDCAADEFCNAPDCSTRGVCAPRPNVSSPRWQLACGCDGVTYWNKQHANFLGKTTNTDTYCTGAARKLCDAGRPCGAGEHCSIQYGTNVVTCPGTNPQISQCVNNPRTVDCTTGTKNGGATCGGVCRNDCERWAEDETLQFEQSCLAPTP